MAENPVYENQEPEAADGMATEKNSGGGWKDSGNQYEEADSSEIQVNFDDFMRDKPYAGMPKEVLLKYSRQRKYVWAREILTVIVFLTTFILLALVISVVAISPSCLEFWQTSPIYHIYPKSFRSSDDTNGYGDLEGIVEKLDYLNDELVVKVVAVDSIYESPRIDKSDYDISDFRQIDSIYGTMSNMENLIIQVHNRGMKLVMDFVPNHSSDKHKWFLASSNTSHPDHDVYKDYYIWVPGASAADVPNNWVTETDSGSAWTWNDDRMEFYYHTFSSEQPDLNLRNKNVRDELKNILRFWLEKGIDGFRSVGTTFMLEATHLRNNPMVDSNRTATRDNLYSDYTQNYHGVHDIIAEWKEILDEYSTEPGVYRFFETDVRGNLETTLRYYGSDITKEADFPTNNLFATTNDNEWTAEKVGSKIMSWMTDMPDGRWPNWALTSEHGTRIASRGGSKIALCAALVSMTLPGTPSIYYGDEIGMVDDPSSSTPAVRSPMQWSMEDNAGFCGNCTPWTLPNSNYMSAVTVKNETVDDNSVLSMYKKLITLRSEMVFQRGYLCVLGDIGGVLVYIRELSGLRSMISLVNFRDETSPTLNLMGAYPSLPSGGTVELFTDAVGPFLSGRSVQFDGIQMPPQSGVVISFEPQELLSKETSMADKCFINLKLCYNNALQVVHNC